MLLETTCGAGASWAQDAGPEIAPVDVTARQRRPVRKPAARLPARITAARASRPVVRDARQPAPPAATAVTAGPGGAGRVAAGPGAAGAANGGAAETATGPVTGYRATRSSTATRTDTALRDIPQTVNVVGRDVLVDQQDTRLTDALQNVSNVQPAGTLQGRDETYVIRGFNTQVTAINGILLNPASNFSSVQRDLGDVERIEVLKGPASVLYGRGDPGGTINIVTRRPTEETTADASLQGGSFGFRRLQGSVSSGVPGAEGMAARLSFAAQDDPTFRDYLGNDNTRSFVAPALSYTPTADTRIEILTEFTRQSTQYDEGLIAVNGRVPLDDISRYYGEKTSRYHGTANYAAVRVEHDLNSNVTVREVLGLQDGGFDFYGTRALSVNGAGTTVTRRVNRTESTYSAIDSQTEVVAKFDLFGIRNTALTGFEYVKGDRHSYITQASIGSISLLDPVHGALPTSAETLQSDLRQKNELLGLYAQDQIDLGHGLQLLAGVRYDFGNQFYFNRLPTSKTTPPVQELSGVSPRAGVVYRPLDPLTFYASYATSFIPQTASVLGAANPTPETGVQYEVGSRLDITPTLTLSAALFQITRNNVAATDPVNTGYSVITGQQRAQGAEADLTGEILPGWKVIGSLGYVDARVTRDTTYRVGNLIPAVPALSGSAWTTYQVQEGTLKGVGLGGGVTVVGKRYGDLTNSYSVDGYARLDATAFYDIDKHTRFSINVRNLTDARYIEQPFNQFNNAPGAPLTAIATLTARL